MPAHHHGVTDEPAPTTLTVRDRLTAAGLSDERIAEHVAAGRVPGRRRARHRPGHAVGGWDAGRDLDRVSGTLGLSLCALAARSGGMLPR